MFVHVKENFLGFGPFYSCYAYMLLPDAIYYFFCIEVRSVLYVLFVDIDIADAVKTSLAEFI